jgi:hypothetical protein
VETMGEVLTRLVRRYQELSAVCYRAATASRDERGRFRRGRRGGGPHAALLKKIDLDLALEQVYRRFFGDHGAEANSTSTSNNRPHGSETFHAAPSSCHDRPVTPA